MKLRKSAVNRHGDDAQLSRWCPAYRTDMGPVLISPQSWNSSSEASRCRPVWQEMQWYSTYWNFWLTLLLSDMHHISIYSPSFCMVMLARRTEEVKLFWDVTSCRMVRSCRRFGEAFCLLLSLRCTKGAETGWWQQDPPKYQLVFINRCRLSSHNMRYAYVKKKYVN